MTDTLARPDQRPGFLTIPPELRQLIYTCVFSSNLRISISAVPYRTPDPPSDPEDETTSWPSYAETWAITTHPLSAQLLGVCKKIKAEATPFLYSHRVFELTAPESLKMLHHNIAIAFSYIRHIVIEWDALQDLAWGLSKPDYHAGMAGLKIVETATWRIRHLGGTLRWRAVKGHERMLCQSAADIIAKHGNLCILAEEKFQRRISAQTENSAQLDTVNENGPSTSFKVKWRLYASIADLKPNEQVLDLGRCLEELKPTAAEAADVGFSLPMIDPF